MDIGCVLRGHGLMRWLALGGAPPWRLSSSQRSLPFAVGAAESLIPPETSIRNVQTEVTIHADKAVI